MNLKHWTTRVLSVLLVTMLCGAPELAQAWQQTSPGNTPEPAAQQPAQEQGQPATQQPAAEQAQPDAQPAAQQPPDAPAPQQQDKKKQDQAPLGAAAAQAGPTAGGAASRPAGNAIAPARQHQMRSLLIKVVAIAAAGAALGLVYGLSRGTSSKPPGTK